VLFPSLAVAWLVLVVAVPGTWAAAERALTLAECLALARDKNPGLGAARERIRELTADYEATRARFFPRVTLISYYQRVDPNRLSPGGAGTTQKLFGREGLTSLTGRQLIFDGLKTYYATRAALLGAKAQEYDVARAADEVTYLVTEAFYRLLEAKEGVRVAETAVQERRAFIELTEAFFRAGKITQVDVAKARSQLLEAEQGLAEAHSAMRLAREILARSIGPEEGAEMDIQGKFSPATEPAGDFADLWRQAETANPEIKRLKTELAQSRALLQAARGGYFPEISLQGSTGVRHRDVGGTREEWLAGVFMEFPLFEGGLTRAQVAKAASQHRQTQERQRDRLNSLRVELLSAWKIMEDARQGVAAARQNLAASEEAYRSALALYRVGKATGLDVLTAEVELTRARLGQLRYRVTYEIGRAKVKQLVGGQDGEAGPPWPRPGEGP